MQKTNQKYLRIEKVIKRKSDEFMLNEKEAIIRLIDGLTKKRYINEGLFSRTKIFRRERVKVELDLSNYTTKAEWKNTAGVNTSKFSKEIDSADLKSNFNKLDIDKLKMFQQI